MFKDLKSYSKSTRSNTYGFLAALPLFVAYEIFLLGMAPSSGPMVRVGAEVWTKEVLWMIGLHGQLALGIVVIFLGGVILWRERRKNIPIRTSYFLGLLLESALYAVVFAVLISSIVGIIFAVTAPIDSDRLTLIGLSIGAGLYEELFFRVLLVSGFFFVVRGLSNMDRSRSYAVAAVVGAVLFSLVHYLGPMGDVFTLASFVFRFLFGLALNVLYVTRGFAIAAWTHALYDLMLIV